MAMKSSRRSANRPKIELVFEGELDSAALERLEKLIAEILVDEWLREQSEKSETQSTAGDAV